MRSAVGRIAVSRRSRPPTDITPGTRGPTRRSTHQCQVISRLLHSLHCNICNTVSMITITIVSVRHGASLGPATTALELINVQQVRHGESIGTGSPPQFSH